MRVPSNRAHPGRNTRSVTLGAPAASRVRVADLEREIDQANTWKLDVRLELDVRLVGVR